MPYPPDLKTGLEKVEPWELVTGELCCYEGRPRGQPVYRFYGYFDSWHRDLQQRHSRVRGTVLWNHIGNKRSRPQRVRVGVLRAAWFRVRMPPPPRDCVRIELDKVQLGDLVYLAAVGMESCVPLIVHDIADYQGCFRDSVGWRTEDADPTHPAFYRSWSLFDRCCPPEYYYVPKTILPRRSRVVKQLEVEE